MARTNRIAFVAIVSTILMGCSQSKSGSTSQSLITSSITSQASEQTSLSSIPTQSLTSSSEPIKTFEEKLKALSSVKKVEKVAIESLTSSFKEIYSVLFEQQIDWNDLAKGTFLQRVYIFYNSEEAVTEYKAGGYYLKNINTYSSNDLDEFYTKYNGNFIDLEYRMFGESHPSDFKFDETKYYEYQTSFHASKDFHNIISSLSSILKGKKIFTGGSKGGYTTEALAYYYPNDIDAYVSFVAPLCDGINDSRFMDNLYTSIGDLKYGTAQAKEYRDLMLNFQKTVLSEKFRYKLQDEVMDYSIKEGYTKVQVSEQELYEIAVIETVTSVWQYYQQFDRISSALDLPEEDETDVDMKVMALKSFFEEAGIKKTMYVDGPLTPYFVQSYIEMGSPSYNLDYLRDAGANIKTQKSRDSSLMFDAFISKTQKETFTYSNSMRNNLINFFNTTTKDIIKIYGLVDTWYAVKAPDTTNPHIHTFNGKFSHLGSISNLEEADKNECWDLINNLLK